MPGGCGLHEQKSDGDKINCHRLQTQAALYDPSLTRL